MKIDKNPIIKKLLAFNLPADDYAIFGSGPMFAHGLKNLEHDVDVIARDKAWKKAQEYDKPQKAYSGNSLVVKLENGAIEIFNNWAPGNWDVDKLIDTAEIVDGVRFVTLSNVIKWKRMFGRKKDFKHIKIIEEYLVRNKEKSPK